MNHGISDNDRKKAEEAGIRFYASTEEKELAYLKEGIARTPKERFLFLLKLMSMQRTMSKATHHK